MAKLMSKKTREIVQTVAVIVAVVLFIIFYMIVPLIAVPKLAARPDREDFEDPEYSPANDPTAFTDIGLAPDTFKVVSRDNIDLAALYFNPDSIDSPRGTVILAPPSDTDRTAVIPYIAPLTARGLAVITYDQRATGFSGGIWHTGGNYEGEDLVDLIADLNIHERLNAPVVAVGFGMGGDAAIKAAANEKRIDAIVLVDPLLTGYRWFETRIEKVSAMRIPLSNRTYYWWFRKISGFPYDRVKVDDLTALSTRTLLLMPPDDLENEAPGRLIELTPAELLTVVPLPSDQSALAGKIIDFVESLPEPATDSTR